MPTAAEQYQQALALAKSGKYGAALTILKDVQHPKARELEAKIRAKMDDGFESLDSPVKPAGNQQAKLARLEDEIKSREGQQRSATIVFIFCLLLSPVGIGILLLPFALFNYYRHKRAGNKLKQQRLDLLEAM